MPDKKSNKSAAKKGRSHGSKSQTPSRKGGSKTKSVALAQTQEHTSFIRVDAVSQNGRRILRVNLKDSMGELYGPARENGIKSDSIPFSLASNSLSLASLGQVYPKLQGLARICSRFMVRRCCLHWQSLCSADTKGSIALAIVPGLVEPVISNAEMASFAYSKIGPLWNSFSTADYRNLESRWFFCDATTSFGDTPQDNVPFSILRLAKNDDNREIGLVWLEMEIDFVDLRPAPQSAVSLQAGVPSTGQQSVSATGSPGNLLQWGLNNSMDGLFEWGKDFAQEYFSSAAPTTPVTSPPGAAIGIDGDAEFDAWLDLILGAVTTVSPQSPKLLHEWPLAGSWDEVKSPDRPVYPRPWSHPVRRRVICSFKSAKEARAARLAGFTPERFIAESPNAAGDFAVTLYFQPAEPYAVLEVLHNEVISAGTGALTTRINVATNSDLGPGHLYWYVQPTTTGESRTVLPNTSQTIDVLKRVAF